MCTSSMGWRGLTSRWWRILQTGRSKPFIISKNEFYKPSLLSSVRAQSSKVQWQSDTQGLDPKQLQDFHDEQLIKVNDNDEVLGPISKGESHAIETIRRRVYHRALSLLIFDEQNRFLLTQRSSKKITFPNYFTNACCSHPLYNEKELEDDGNAIGVRRATIRRTKFELGIDNIKEDEINFVNRLAYRAESDSGKWGEAEIDYIFVLRKNVHVKPNPNEVQEVKYVTRDEMKDMLSSDKFKLTPWMRLLSHELLFKYWDNLDDLSKVSRTDTILRAELH